MGLLTRENQSKSIKLISKFLSSAQVVSLPSTISSIPPGLLLAQLSPAKDSAEPLALWSAEAWQADPKSFFEREDYGQDFFHLSGRNPYFSQVFKLLSSVKTTLCATPNGLSLLSCQKKENMKLRYHCKEKSGPKSLLLYFDKLEGLWLLRYHHYLFYHIPRNIQQSSKHYSKSTLKFTLESTCCLQYIKEAFLNSVLYLNKCILIVWSSSQVSD